MRRLPVNLVILGALVLVVMGLIWRSQRAAPPVVAHNPHGWMAFQEPTLITGDVDLARMKQLLMVRQGGLQGCYDRQLRSDPMLTGTLNIELAIGESGSVTEVELDADDLNSPPTSECILGAMQQWTLSPPKSPAARVAVPLVLYPHGEVQLDQPLDFAKL